MTDSEGLEGNLYPQVLGPRENLAREFGARVAAELRRR